MNIHEFIERLKEMPVDITPHLEKIQQALDGTDDLTKTKIGGTAVCGSKNYLPLLGIVYVVSIMGEGKEIEEEISPALVAEFGAPIMINIDEPGKRQYYFNAPPQKLPETYLEQVLGRDRIHEICQKWGLTQDEEQAINDIIVASQIFLHNILGKVNHMQARLQDFEASRVEIITSALYEIMSEFAIQSLSKSGRKGPS